jgi:hypothetical protein
MIGSSRSGLHGTGTIPETPRRNPCRPAETDHAMTDITQRSTASGLVKQVFIRRGRKLLTNVSTRTLIPAIRQSELLPDDEFSTDGVHWGRLGDHSQLSRFFPEVDEADAPAGPIPPQVEEQLYDLACLMRDINK